MTEETIKKDMELCELCNYKEIKIIKGKKCFMDEINEELTYGFNPNFEKALNAASNLNYMEESVKKLENNDNDDLKKLAKFIRFVQNSDFKYRNFLEIMNINENSMSQIFHWLMDIDKAKEIYGTEKYKDSIQYIFTNEFLKYINKEKKILEDIEYTIDKCTCKFNEVFKIDILIEVEYKDKNNKSYKYVYVIENKKNAPLSCTKPDEDKDKYKTQIEIYREKIDKEDKYNEYKKAFIFMCSKKSLYLNDFVCQHVKPKEAENNLTIRGKEANTDDMAINELLSEFDYSPVEHGELAIILYTALKEYILKHNKKLNDYFGNEILKPAEYNMDTLYSYILKILGMCNEKCKTVTKIKKFLKVKEIKETLNKKTVISFSKHINPEYKKINYGKSPRIGQMQINFHDSLLEIQKSNGDFILELLCRFIEYIELHYDYGYLKDNVIGNTKIIDGKYIEDVCYDIFTNEDKTIFENLDNSIQNLIKEMIRFRLFIKLIKDIKKDKIEIENACILNGKYGFERSSQNFEIRFIPADCKDKLEYVPNYESKQNQPIFYIAIESTLDIVTPQIHFCLALAPCNKENIEDVKNKKILFDTIQSVLNDNQKYDYREKSGCDRWHTFDKYNYFNFNFETDFSEILNFDERKNVINNLIKEYKEIIEKFNKAKN